MKSFILRTAICDSHICIESGKILCRTSMTNPLF